MLIQVLLQMPIQLILPQSPPWTTTVVECALYTSPHAHCTILGRSILTDQQMVLQFIRGQDFGAPERRILTGFEQLVDLSLSEVVHKDVPSTVQEFIVDGTTGLVLTVESGELL